MSVVLPCFVRAGLDASAVGGSGRLRGGADGFGQRPGVDHTGDAQSAPEGAPTLRQLEASRYGVDMRSPARPSACRIGHDDEMLDVGFDRDKPQ
jgi:hypothetical protein